MAYSQTDLDNIRAAIAKGTLTVKIDGHEVTYRSLDELTRIESIIERALTASGRAPGRFRIIGRSGLR